MDDPHLPSVGARFSIGAFRGTVRYIGEVEGTKGIWLGVEWDDASRGKHSGTRGSTFYFTCRVANSGSFIRPSSKMSFGSSFLRALETKYSADALPIIEKKSVKYGRRNLADIEVETPNMESVIKRSTQLHKLREVGLGGWKADSFTSDVNIHDTEGRIDVACAFDDKLGEKEGDIQKTCPNIRGLDLSRSLLPSWLEVSKIAIELPLLDTLQLHFNRFADLSTTTMPLANAFTRLRDLKVDGTFMSWQDVILLADAFPALESLQIGFNGIERLNGRQAVSKGRLCKLKVLNLEGNSLSDWYDAWSSIEICPSLERLVLSSNKISHISTAIAGTRQNQIRHVSVWDNPISSWTDIDSLDACVGGLESLVLGGNHCVLTKDMAMQDVRLIAIARLPRLQSFNNTSILAIERREAELYYISSVEKEHPSEERKQLHPRWAHLCQLHGITPTVNGKGEEVKDNSNGASGTLRNNLLIVTVHLSTQPPSSQPPYVHSAPSSYTTQRLELNLLTTTPLRLLKSKLARSFSLKKGPQSIQSIWALLSPTLDPLQTTAQLLRDKMRPQETIATMPSNERIIYEMDSLERNLRDYNFSHGDEIVLVIGI